mmetsp:Transcript_23513/g.63714  ORF Transcript_23513/g.63714 Transcript_23513/m.63714 type:complete len:299 (-) Transcript_23513:1626-2522(-)
MVPHTSRILSARATSDIYESWATDDLSGENLRITIDCSDDEAHEEPDHGDASEEQNLAAGVCSRPTLRVRQHPYSAEVSPASFQTCLRASSGPGMPPSRASAFFWADAEEISASPWRGAHHGRSRRPRRSVEERRRPLCQNVAAARPSAPPVQMLELSLKRMSMTTCVHARGWSSMTSIAISPHDCRSRALRAGCSGAADSGTRGVTDRMALACRGRTWPASSARCTSAASAWMTLTGGTTSCDACLSVVCHWADLGWQRRSAGSSLPPRTPCARRARGGRGRKNPVTLAQKMRIIFE